MLSAQAPAVLRDQRFGNALHSNVKLVRVAPANRRSGAAVVRNTLVMPSLRDQATSTDWRHQMSGPLLWQSTWKQAAEHGVSPALSPTWKVTLLSDGSVTRHLQLMTGHTVDVDNLEQIDIGMRLSGLPDNVAIVAGPRSQREVHLDVKGETLVCASSWWNTAQISGYLGETQKPIWVNLSSKRTEIYREITQIYCGHSADLEKRFGHPGPFWGREYIFWQGRQPITLMHEIFSPALERFLGPTHI